MKFFGSPKTPVVPDKKTDAAGSLQSPFKQGLQAANGKQSEESPLQKSILAWDVPAILKLDLKSLGAELEKSDDKKKLLIERALDKHDEIVAAAIHPNFMRALMHLINAYKSVAQKPKDTIENLLRYIMMLPLGTHDKGQIDELIKQLFPEPVNNTVTQSTNSGSAPAASVIIATAVVPAATATVTSAAANNSNNSSAAVSKNFKKTPRLEGHIATNHSETDSDDTDESFSGSSSGSYEGDYIDNYSKLMSRNGNDSDPDQSSDNDSVSFEGPAVKSVPLTIEEVTPRDDDEETKKNISAANMQKSDADLTTASIAVLTTAQSTQSDQPTTAIVAARTDHSLTAATPTSKIIPSVPSLASAFQTSGIAKNNELRRVARESQDDSRAALSVSSGAAVPSVETPAIAPNDGLRRRSSKSQDNSKASFNASSSAAVLSVDTSAIAPNDGLKRRASSSAAIPPVASVVVLNDGPKKTPSKSKKSGASLNGSSNAAVSPPVVAPNDALRRESSKSRDINTASFIDGENNNALMDAPPPLELPPSLAGVATGSRQEDNNKSNEKDKTKKSSKRAASTSDSSHRHHRSENISAETKSEKSSHSHRRHRSENKSGNVAVSTAEQQPVTTDEDKKHRRRRRSPNQDVTQDSLSSSFSFNTKPLWQRDLTLANELIEAIRQHTSVAELEKKIKEPVNVLNEVITEDGKTLLHLACYHLHVDAIKMLVENGIDINAKDKEGSTALDYLNHPDKIIKRTASKYKTDSKLIGARNSALEFLNNHENYPFYKAVSALDDTRATATVVSYKDFMLRTNSQKQTLLHQLASNKANKPLQDALLVKIAQLILANVKEDKANNSDNRATLLNEQDEAGDTVLHLACRLGFLELAIFLAGFQVERSNKANAKLKNVAGDTCLFDLIDFYNANKRIVTENGDALKKISELIGLLLSAGAKVDDVNSKRNDTGKATPVKMANGDITLQNILSASVAEQNLRKAAQPFEDSELKDLLKKYIELQYYYAQYKLLQKDNKDGEDFAFIERYVTAAYNHAEAFLDFDEAKENEYASKIKDSVAVAAGNLVALEQRFKDLLPIQQSSSFEATKVAAIKRMIAAFEQQTKINLLRSRKILVQAKARIGVILGMILKDYEKENNTPQALKDFLKNMPELLPYLKNNQTEIGKSGSSPAVPRKPDSVPSSLSSSGAKILASLGSTGESPTSAAKTSNGKSSSSPAKPSGHAPVPSAATNLDTQLDTVLKMSAADVVGDKEESSSPRHGFGSDSES